MRLPTLFNLLLSTNLPVAYDHWDEPPQFPYLVYLMEVTDNFGADNKVYYEGNSFRVEIYTDIKDLAVEKLVEDTFDNNDIFWERSETYIESEKMFQITYSI